MVTSAVVGVAYGPAAAGDKAPIGRLAQAATPGSTAPATSPFSAEQKAAIGQIIKEYLLANPEVLALAPDLAAQRVGDTHELHPLLKDIFSGPLPEQIGCQTGPRADLQHVIAQVRHVENPWQEVGL